MHSIIHDLLTQIHRKRADVLKVLGQFIAKALLDSRIIDIAMSKIFLKFILNEDVPMTVASLKVRCQ